MEMPFQYVQHVAAVEAAACMVATQISMPMSCIVGQCGSPADAAAAS